MNIKKIGLTALAASLVSVSAHAGALSVSGGASIGVKDTSKTSTGKSFTMGNSVTFTGSGELDNGMNVAISFELDQGAEAGTAGAAGKGPFDSHSVTVSSDELGTLVFAGHGDLLLSQKSILLLLVMLGTMVQTSQYQHQVLATTCCCIHFQHLLMM